MHHTAKGFTLIELMVVVGIIAVLAGIGTLAIVSTIPTYGLSRAARDMVSNFRKARTMAIKYNRNVIVAFDVDKKSYSVDGVIFPAIESGKYKNLNDHYGGGVDYGFPGRSTKVTFTDKKVTFNSMGQTGGATGYVFLKNRNNAGYRVGVRGMGNIVMEKCGQKGSDGVLVTCLE